MNNSVGRDRRLRLAIVADDLTGALDAAAVFAGIPGGVVVATRLEALRDALQRDAGVVAVSCRSREIEAAVARRRVEDVLKELPAGIRIFKKVDSRLKGNIAAELQPFGARRMIVAPAIPEFGRIVRGGALQGFGVDRPIPVRDRLGPLAEDAAVPDTETPHDMSEIARSAPTTAILVGARGLATALAKCMGVSAAPDERPLPRPLCFAVGSRDPITLRQVDSLRAAGPDLQYVPAPAGLFSRRPQTEPTAPVTLLQTTEAEEADAASDAVLDRFAEGAAPWLRSARAMLLTGGATAEAILDALKIALLTVVGEALPGMPLTEAEGRVIVTKSGGFGAPDAFVRLAGYPAMAGA